jgi:DNA helicase-2/ATP-dependent DNA helicase PcrA
MQNVYQENMNMLNELQKEAVNAIDGPVMVVAGPGTGKTQILTLRIANILDKTDTEPENILALTFTESGVQAMRKRLAKMVGSTAYRVNIYTFHSFANDIIQQHPEDFPTIIGASPVTDVEQIGLLEEIIVATDLETLKPFGDTLYYIKSIKSKISELKREGVTVEDFEGIVSKEKEVFSKIDDLHYESGAHSGKMKGKYKTAEKTLSKNSELLDVYRLYQGELRSRKWYDFDDMIVELLRSLRANPDLLLTLQEKFMYFLVDEHQDTNNAQNKILELLANFHENPNLFVVGDEKQSVFRFQGASLENFFYFRHLYSNALLITLDQNYRSTQTILDASHSLLPADVSLSANAPHENKHINLTEFPLIPQELNWVAEEIKQLIEDGVEAEEIAVLYRNNRHAFPMADMLDRSGIKYSIESDQSLFDGKDIKRLLTVMRGVQMLDSNEELSKLLFLDIFDLSPVVISKLIRAAYQKRKKLLIDLLSEEKELKILGLSKTEIEGLQEIYANLLSWKKYAENETVAGTLEHLLRESGLLQIIMGSTTATDRLDSLNKFFDLAREFARSDRSLKLVDFIEYLKLLEQHGINVKQRSSRVKEGHVRLMTSHRSKGLEFDYVFCINVNDGIWGNQKKRELLPLIDAVYTLFDTVPIDDYADTVSDTNAEERRLFYVALTRAKKGIYLSYSLEGAAGRELLPSQFIGEIKDEYIQFLDTKEFSHSWSEKQSILFSEKIASNISNDEYFEQMKSFVREKFKSQALSVSALNNYLKSPWLYFFRNLVRLPSAMNKHMAYGNAVHGAMQDFFEAARGEKYEPLDYFLGKFKHHLQGQELSEVDYEDSYRKGIESLTSWYNEYEGTWNLFTRNEFRINGVYLPGTENDEVPIRLTGILDKLEFEEFNENEVIVVDYKTGKPKTEGQIRGTTKDSTGDYYRQLVFYKLLLKYFADGRIKMQKGILEFVEQDSKGGYRKYDFEIPDDDVLDLEEEVRKVSDEIINLKFWNEPVNDEAEDYRELVEALRR